MKSNTKNLDKIRLKTAKIKAKKLQQYNIAPKPFSLFSSFDSYCPYIAL